MVWLWKRMYLNYLKSDFNRNYFLVIINNSKFLVKIFWKIYWIINWIIFWFIYNIIIWKKLKNLRSSVWIYVFYEISNKYVWWN